MEWITWFVVSFIALVIVLIQGGMEGCLTAGLLAIAISSVIAWLPFPFYVQVAFFIFLMLIIFVGLKRWEASSINPLVSGWGAIKEEPNHGDVVGGNASVMSDFSSDDVNAELRVLWQGQSWAAKCVVTPCQLYRGQDVEVLSREGTCLKVRPY